MEARVVYSILRVSEPRARLSHPKSLTTLMLCPKASIMVNWLTNSHQCRAIRVRKLILFAGGSL